PAPAPAAQPAPASAPAVSATALAEANRSVRSSPVARKIARENNVDLSRVAGTGRNGRVSKNDVLGYVASGAVSASAPAPAPGPGAAPASPKASPGAAPMIPAGFTDPGGSGIGIQPVLNFPDGADSIVQDMTNIRQIIAKHMLASRATSAHVQSVTEVDFGRVMALRRKWKADFTSRHDANLSVTTMVLYAIVPALRNWPIVNASVVNGNQLEYHKHVNLGVAAALPDGLIVPVIKQAEQKGIGQIARELADLAGRARSKSIAPDEVSGSTFTVTNPGVFGTDFGLPVINQPNVAILGLGGIKKRVKVIESEYGDAMAIRPTSLFCLSYDHRIIDGAVSSQFLEEVRERIENFPEDVLGR
ncbi:MAG: 2-oxoglutarate dehydrogenase, partial [Gemmatimonadetes bacterium]|nr:2-oxoglutarate dehydrogenase [Gemmatimonadota bacterium]